MTIKELYIASNKTEQKVVAHIADDQWSLVMPEKITHEPMTLSTPVLRRFPRKGISAAQR